MTKQIERDQTETTTTTIEQPRPTTAGLVARAVCLGLLAGAVGMTTACCAGANEGEGEGE